MSGWNSLALQQFLDDARYALRGMRRSPRFTVVAVLSLALGIGANTAIFSLIDALMLRALPVRDPQQLVELLSHYPGEPRGSWFSWQSYQHYRDNNHVFSGLVGVSPSRFNLHVQNQESGGHDRETVDGEYIVGFPVLGVKPAIGRMIAADDERTGASASAVAVVSWSYWKTRFNLDPAIVGQRITVNDIPLTIIGVTPPEFFGLQAGYTPEIWVPLTAEPIVNHTRPLDGTLALAGRLKPGVSIGQARAEMAVLFQFTIDERASASPNPNPLIRQTKLEVEPAGAGLTALRDRFAKPLLLLMSAVGLLLLMACINLASMLLARGAARQREMALRVSLGASRLRIVRQVLTESVLLSVAGSLPGLALAYFGAGALVRILTSGRRDPGLAFHIDIQLRPEMHVLLFTAAIALFTGLLFGLAPAWSAFASAPASSLREIARSGETRGRKLFGKSLVVAQVALSVVLLSAAGLFVRNLSNLENMDLGFRRDHVLLLNLDPSGSGYSAERLSSAYRELLARLDAIPGVRSATIGNTPISGAGASSFATAEGFEEHPEDRRYVSLNWVAPKYFETLGMPFLAGRDFSFQDEGGPRIAIINQAMARYFFGNRNPIGKHIALDRDWKGFGVDQPYEVVGVVGDAHYYEIREAPKRIVYFNAYSEARVSSMFAIRTSVDPASAAPEVRRTVRELFPAISVARLTTLEDQVDASIVPERVIATLSGLFGALGSLLAAIGLYGLLAYTVARRINEIGIRMALGATRSRVTRMVLGDALRMVLAGLIVGAPLAFWGRTFAASLIQDLPLQSPVPVVFGAMAMIAVALVAAYAPARRAARVEPMEALRHE